MYLVLLQHGMDDLPIFLTPLYAKAVTRAKKLRAMPTTAIRKVMGTDASTPSCVSIVTFANGGAPIGREVVKTFD